MILLQYLTAGLTDQTATIKWSEISDWWGFPWWLGNIANGLAPGSPRHSLSIQFSSILPLASFHLTERAAVCLSWEPANRLRIILGPGRLLHIPFGPPSSWSTELPLIVTGPKVHCITASQLPLLFRVLLANNYSIISPNVWLKMKGKNKRNDKKKYISHIIYHTSQHCWFSHQKNSVTEC